MATGQTFTVGTTFGCSSGPTYAGTTTNQPPANGNVSINPQAFVPAGNTDVTIYGETIVKNNVTGYGAQMSLIALNGQVNTPQVTVKFKAANAGNTDLTYVLQSGQSLAFSSNSQMSYNTTSITVTPDPVSNTQVNIIVMVNS